MKQLLAKIKAINPKIWFVLLLLIFALNYDYVSVLNKRPQSVHHWRQADCASLALNYYQNGMNFFQPQTHNLTSLGNTSGYAAPSEIPFGYYFIAILYSIFGYNDIIYRLVNTLIFLIGIYYLFRTFDILLKDSFWAISASLLFFTSPVLVYYGNNFLTDINALSISFIAWYFFFKYYLNSLPKYLYLSMLFFFLAASYKITALISLATICIIFAIELIGVCKFGKEKQKLFKHPIQTIILFTAVFAMIGAWVLFAKAYNAKYASGYFSTTIFPLWEMTTGDIDKVITNIKELWLPQYFHKITLYLLGGLLIINTILIRKANRIINISSIIILLFSIIFSILWFATLRDHDYYIINLYILPIFIILNALALLKENYPKIFQSLALKILFSIVLILNFYHAKTQQYERYNGWWNEYHEYKDYHTITPYLRSIGINPLDTIISLPDYSHFTLYLTNQRGWTHCLGLNQDSTAIALSIKKGAKYLISHDSTTIHKPYLNSFTKHQIGEYNSIKIYDLR